MTAVEATYARDHGLAAGRRLGCTATIDADVVDRRSAREPGLPAGRAQGGRRAGDRGRPGRPPLLRRGRGARSSRRRRATPARLLAALEREWGLAGARARAARLAGSPACSTQGRAVAGHGRRARRDAVTGDLARASTTPPTGSRSTSGSTTVAGHLCDLRSGDVLASAGEMNPQIRFGEDLMSRVSYVMLNAGSEKELTRVVRGCLAKLTAELARDGGRRAGRRARGHARREPRDAPPAARHRPDRARRRAVCARRRRPALRLRAAELGLPVNAGARAYVLPCIAGHVGADTAGVILSEAPYEADEVTLIVDVGTNAEIVLGNRERLLAASSPTGPAFEGAQISLRPARRAWCDRARP